MTLCTPAGWHGGSRTQGCARQGCGCVGQGWGYVEQGRDCRVLGEPPGEWGAAALGHFVARPRLGGCPGSPGAALAPRAVRELPAPPLPQPMFGPQLQQGHKRQRGEGAGTAPAASGPPRGGRPEEPPPGPGLGARG